MNDRTQTQLDFLRGDDQFQVLMHNLYSQAASVATSPFGDRKRKFNDFKEIAELDMVMYLLSSIQVEWSGSKKQISDMELEK